MLTKAITEKTLMDTAGQKCYYNQQKKFLFLQPRARANIYIKLLSQLWLWCYTFNCSNLKKIKKWFSDIYH